MTEKLTKRFVKIIETIHDDIVAVSDPGKIDNHKEFLKNLPIGVVQDGLRPGISLHNLAYKVLNFMDKHPKDNIGLSAFVIEDVATKHYFWDGNKRTAFVLAGALLGSEGILLELDYLNAVDFLIKVASGKANKAEIKKWILEHSKTMSKGENK